mgnify:CR=1 FL=1
MPKIVDSLIKTAQDTYERAYNIGKDPKKALKPAGAVKRKHTIVFFFKREIIHNDNTVLPPPHFKEINPPPLSSAAFM